MSTQFILQIAIILIAAYTIYADSSCPRVVTFNTAMLQTDGRAGYEDRVPRAISAMDANDADVMCLQEVWLESDMRQVLATLGAKYSHHYSHIHYRVGDIRKPWAEMGLLERVKSLSVFSPCSVGDATRVITRVLTCILFNGCQAAGGSQEVLQCAAQKCNSQLKSVAQDCLSCLAVSLGGGAGGVLEACMPDITERRNSFNGPGLMLLSKRPMTDVSAQEFFPGKRAIIQKATLQADIEGVGKVVCTHLSSIGSTYFEYDIDFESFEAKNAEEIRLLIERHGDSDHLLMGDLNVGLEDANKNVPAEYPDNFQMLIDAGYTAPYLQQDGRCTFCRDARLDDGDQGDVVIDHVMVMGGSVELVDVQRTLDQTSPAPYSDHKGVEARVCPAAE